LGRKTIENQQIGLFRVDTKFEDSGFEIYDSNNSTIKQLNNSTKKQNTPSHCSPNVTRKNTCLNFFLFFALFSAY
jgi:hypothetical protein